MKKTGLLVPLLFAVYLLLLIWIILFKLEFSISVLKTSRSINLIPFYYENEIGMGFHLKEVLENAVIFIPLGIYLCMLKHDFSVKVKFIFILMTSLILEISQYILAVGRTDVTDLITNTCGCDTKSLNLTVWRQCRPNHPFRWMKPLSPALPVMALLGSGHKRNPIWNPNREGRMKLRAAMRLGCRLLLIAWLIN